MKLFIKIKGVKYKLVKENSDNNNDAGHACDFCQIPSEKQCKKASKLCKGPKHFFVEKIKKEDKS